MIHVPLDRMIHVPLDRMIHVPLDRNLKINPIYKTIKPGWFNTSR